MKSQNNFDINKITVCSFMVSQREFKQKATLCQINSIAWKNVIEFKKNLQKKNMPESTDIKKNHTRTLPQMFKFEDTIIYVICIA